MEVVIDILDKLQKILFPGYFRIKSYRYYTMENNLQTLVEDVLFNLSKQITRFIRFLPEYQDKDFRACQARGQELALEFLSRIPKIRDLVDSTVQAEFDGDRRPSARTRSSIAIPVCTPSWSSAWPTNSTN